MREHLHVWTPINHGPDQLLRYRCLTCHKMRKRRPRPHWVILRRWRRARAACFVLVVAGSSALARRAG